jgi:multidrug resistance efflux pump
LTVDPPTSEIQGRQLFSMPAERFLTLFGSAALVYTIALVGFLTYYSGEWVFQEFGSDALGLFSLVLVGLLHKPVITAASTAKEVSKEKWDKLREEKRRPRFVSLWFLAIAAILLFPWQLRVASDLVILPQEREIVRAPADGRIAAVFFREGDTVQAGDLLVEYDTSELQLKRKTKQAELAQAREALRLLEKRNPTAREEIRVKERELDTARALEAAARQEFARAQQVWTAGLISMEEFEGVKHALEQAVARTHEAEAEIALARKSSPESRMEEMERLHLLDPGAQQAAIEKLEAELAQLDDLLARSRVYASVTGTLTTYRFEDKVGEYLEEGASLCEIVNDEHVIVEMPVSEKDIDVVELGRDMQFKVRGFPAQRFHATVDEIAPVATEHDTGSAILVRAHMKNESGVLKPGMTGVAKIYCGLSVVAHVFTRDLVRFVRTEFWL